MHVLSITVSNNMQPLQSHQTSGAAHVVCQRGQFVGDPICLQRQRRSAQIEEQQARVEKLTRTGKLTT